MKKKYKLLIIILLLTICTGCTKSLKDGKEIVKNKETGQTLTSNILCQPSEKQLYETYVKYDDKLQVKMDDLPTCEKFTPGKLKYQSLWETIFVKPLAFIILKLGYLVKDMGLSVMIIGLLIRLILLPFQVKTVKQSEAMKKIQPEINRIEKKYKDKTDQESMMMKSQETMAIYKKYNINPVGGCLTALIQLPVFFAFLEAINRVPAIFEHDFLHTSWNLGMTPSTGISQGHYTYIILILLIIVTTYFSFKFSMNSQPGQSNEMASQMKMMTTFMMITITITSLSLPTAIALYWIVTNGFAVVQNIIVKKIIGKKE